MKRFLWLALFAASVSALGAEELVAPAPTGLPSTELVQTWLRQDPSVQEAFAGLAAAEHTAGMLRASPYEFGAEVSSQRRNYDVGPSSNEWSVQVDRTLRLPGKGAIDRQLGSAEIALAQARVGAAFNVAARDFVDLWMDWQGATHRRQLMQEQQVFGDESARVVELRRRAGDASTLEANVVEADSAEIRRQLSLAETEERKARAKLLVRFPGAEGAALDLADPDPITQPEALWKERILRASSPLKISRVEFEQAQMAAERARADRLPDPTIGVYTASEAFSNEQIVGVNLTVPIPGRLRSQRLEQALSQVDMATAALDRQRRLVEVGTDQVFLDATGSFDRWRLAEQSAIRTLENGRLTQRAFSLGEVDLQALLLARRQTVEAADSALNARVLALRSYYSLLVDAQLIWDLDRL